MLMVGVRLEGIEVSRIEHFLCACVRTFVK